MWHLLPTDAKSAISGKQMLLEYHDERLNLSIL